MAPEKFEINDFDGLASSDRADDSRDGIGMAAAVQRHSGIVEVDTVKGGSETIRVAFAADFSVGNDIEARVFLRLDCHECGVFLRFRQVRCRHSP